MAGRARNMTSLIVGAVAIVIITLVLLYGVSRSIHVNYRRD